MKKRKRQFQLTAYVILGVLLVSWFCTQRFIIGPVEDAVMLSVLNIALHGVSLWFMLRLVVWFLYKK